MLCGRTESEKRAIIEKQKRYMSQVKEQFKTTSKRKRSFTKLPSSSFLRTSKRFRINIVGNIGDGDNDLSSDFANENDVSEEVTNFKNPNKYNCDSENNSSDVDFFAPSPASNN